MAAVTVPGIYNLNSIVSVTGGEVTTYAEAYVSAANSASASGSLTHIIYSNDGATTVDSSSPATIIQAEIGEGGTYSLTGGITNIVMGITIGEGADAVVVSGATTINAVSLTSSSLSILLSNAVGVTFEAGNQSGTFVASQGDNLFAASGTTGDWKIILGDGNNTVQGSNGSDYIYGGSGSSQYILGSGADTVIAQGTDTIEGASATGASVVLMGGSASVTLGERAYVSDQASAASTLTLGNNSTVEGGSGATVTFVGAGTITGARGDTISAAGDLTVNEGSDQVVSADGALKFISGTGDSSITAGNGTVWGASGLDALLSISTFGIFTANQTGTTTTEYVDAASSTGNVEFWTGAGSETLIGGSGSDHFVFGTSYNGSTGDSYATVTGGTGAANTFGVLSGHTGGHIYIEDFGSVAGNIFFMYNYKPSNEASAISSLLATATVSGGNTTVQLDNNMQVTFIGVTDLSAASINIS